MLIAIVAAGALLVLAGAGYILLGFDIVVTERGQAMTLGGTIALSAGIVTLAVALVARRVGRLEATLREAMRTPPPVPAASGTTPATAAGLAALAGAAVPTALSALGPDRAAAISEEIPTSAEDRKELTTVTAADALSEAPLASPASTPPVREAPADAAPRAARPAQVSSGRDLAFEAVLEERDRPSPLDRHAEQPVTPAPAPAPPEPASEPALPDPPPPERQVLGRTEAGGRTYVLFDDGSVEAISEAGVERYASLDELRQSLALAATLQP